MDQPNEIPFTPVPLQRTRRHGWTPDNQRAFIAFLARCGSVTAAAQQVGLTPRSAYALLEKDGSESFAKAWDEAVLRGVDAIRDNVIDRVMNGAWVPVVRRGRIVSMKFRYFDHLAIAVLSGRGKDIDEIQEERKRRRDLRRFWREENRARDEKDRAQAAAREKLERETAEYMAIIAEKERQSRLQYPRISLL